MVYLAYTGMDNIFLTEDPDFTHFKTVYTRDQQSSTKVVEHPFDQSYYRPGDTLISTLKQNGDFLSKVSLKVKLPKITPTTSYWVYPDVNKFIGNTVSLFTSAGSKIFDMTVNGLTATTVNQNWLVVTSNTYVPPSTYVSVTTANKFLFNVPSGSYAVFSDISFANFFGFVYNPIQLFGGYVRFNKVNTEQVTFQESGWLSGEQVYNPTYSYLDDTLYKLINSVSLYIGKQLVQEFDSNTIKFYKETNSTYKNRPVLKLLEGNDTVIDDNRVYYFEIPFIVVPVYAIPRHDVQIRIKTNPLSSDVNFFMSLVLTYNTFSTKLPSEHTIIVPQVSYFTNNKLDMKGPVKKIVVSSGNPTFSLSLNGEFFADDVNTKMITFENFTNVPMNSNSVVIFNNPINMSRIRDQEFVSSNTNIYAESLNVLKISNDLSGLLYTTRDTSGYPVVTSSITNPVSTQETYLFDQIPQTVSGMLSFYSMRLVNYGYKGPIIRLRNQNTNEEDDFYTDTTQSFLKTSNGTTINDFSNGSNIRVVTWYDQTINENHLTQSIQVVQPQLVLDGSKYVVAILNDSNNFDSVSPTRWMDITKPVHPQQFAMTMKLNSVGFFQNPVSIFSSQDGLFRITGGNLKGDNNADDWVNLPNSGTTYFTVNGSYASYISAGSWYNITSWKTNAYSGYDMNLIGVSAPGVYQTPSRSMNGYFFEVGFMSQKTLETETVDYYDNRPPL